jgi:hypothetical protein
MDFTKVGSFYINLELITFISISEFNRARGTGQIVVRFSGEASNYVVMKCREALELLEIIESLTTDKKPKDK